MTNIKKKKKKKHDDVHKEMQKHIRNDLEFMKKNFSEKQGDE